MRKYIKIFFVFIGLFLLLYGTLNTIGLNERYKRGDVNGDDVVNSADARYLGLYILGDPEYQILYGDGDVNLDGIVSQVDAYLLIYSLVGPFTIPE